MLDGGYLFDNVSVAGDPADNMEVTGTITPPKPAAAPARKSPAAPKPKPSWAQQMFNFPDGEAPARVDAEPPAARDHRCGPLDAECPT